MWRIAVKHWPLIARAAVVVYAVCSLLGTLLLLNALHQREAEHQAAAEVIQDYEQRVNRLELLWGIEDRLR